MKQIIRKTIGILLALSITAGSAINTLAAGSLVVNYGEEVNFTRFLVANTDSPDTYESVSKSSDEDNGGASASSGSPSIDGQDHGVGMDNWSWAGWLNDNSTWQSPVTNGSGSGSGSNTGSGGTISGVPSPNNITGYNPSDPFAGHRTIEAMFHRAPTTGTALDNLMAKGGGDVKITRMTLDEFLAMIGDKSDEIKGKYEAMKQEAQAQQHGDVDAAQKLLQAMINAFQNGVNAWSGVGNIQPPDTSSWLSSVLDFGIFDLVDLLAEQTKAQNDTVLHLNQDMINMLLDYFKTKYEMFMRNGLYYKIPHDQIPEEYHDNFQMIFDGYLYKDGKKDVKLAEFLASDSDEDIYVVGDKYATTGQLVEKYGSVEAALKEYPDLKTVKELMDGKSFGDLTPEQQEAVKASGIYMESSGMTLAQTMEKYGSLDKMPDDVRDEYERNAYLSGKLDQAYPPEGGTRASTEQKIKEIAENFPTYDSMSDSMKEIMSEAKYDEIMQRAASGEVEEAHEQLVYADLLSAIQTQTAYDDVTPDNGFYGLGAAYLTKSEYEALRSQYLKNPDQFQGDGAVERLKTSVELSDHKSNTFIGMTSDSDGRVIDVPYYCKACKGFFSSKFPCSHHIYNHVESSYETMEDALFVERLATQIAGEHDYGSGIVTLEDMDPSVKTSTVAAYYRDPDSGDVLHGIITNEENIEYYANTTGSSKAFSGPMLGEDLIYMGIQDGDENVTFEKPFNPSIPTVFSGQGDDQEAEIAAQFGLSSGEITMESIIELYMSDFAYKYGDEEKEAIRKMIDDPDDYTAAVNASLITQDISMLTKKEIEAEKEKLIAAGLDPTSFESINAEIGKWEESRSARQEDDEKKRPKLGGEKKEAEAPRDPSEPQPEVEAASELDIDEDDAASYAKRMEEFHEMQKEHTREDSLRLAALAEMSRDAIGAQNENNKAEFTGDFTPLLQNLLDWAQNMQDETTLPEIKDLFSDWFDTSSDDFEEQVQQAADAIDEELAKELEDYKQDVIDQYQKYCDELDEKYKEDIPEDPSLWTGDDIKNAREAIEKAYQEQKIPDMDSFGDDVPRIQDSAEYKEDSVEKIIKDWPEDKKLWNEGMRSFYKEITELAKDPAFAKTFAEMDAQGVFDSDDPNEIIKNMQAYINGFETHTSKAGKEYVYVYGTITASGKMDIDQRKEFDVAGTTIVRLECLTDSGYGVRYGYTWMADQIGTFRATGQYDVTHCYSQTRGYIAHYNLSAKLPNGEMMDILTKDEQIVLVDESGVKAENTHTVNLDPLIIEVIAGDIDLKKTDFYNTKRIQ